MLVLAQSLGLAGMGQPPPGTNSTGSSAAVRTESVETALVGLHYAYPAAVFGYYIISSGVSICSLSDEREHPRRRSLVLLMLASVLSYVAQIAIVLVPSVFSNTWLGQQDAMINLLSCILVFGLQLAVLSDSTQVSWYPFIGSYVVALVSEPVLEIVTFSARPAGSLSGFEIAQLAIIAARYLLICLVLSTYYAWRGTGTSVSATDAEQQPLIPKNTDETSATEGEESTESTSGYGSTSATATNSSDNSEQSDSDSDDDESDSDSDEDSNTKKRTKKKAKTPNELPWERRERKYEERMKKRLKENGNWLEYCKRFMIFFPYVWPVNNRPLQIRAILVGVCLLTNNALNVLIPRQLGIIMDSLNHLNDKNPWAQVIIFGLLKFASSQAGISLLRQWLWLPVEYYSFDAMSTAAYSHILNLSSDFHDTKGSSEIMMAISSGQSIANLLESICFSAIPMVIDLAIAFLYLSATFGPYEGFITFATSVIFLFIAGRMIASLKAARRGEVSAWYEEHHVRQAGILGWSTVASFNQVGHEEGRYGKAVKNKSVKSQSLYIGYLLAYAYQYLILLAGLLAGAFLAVWQVTSGQSTPGQFAMLLTYWSQLVAPLTFFAGLGKSISGNFIHAEQLLEIMTTKPTVVNSEGAKPLEFNGGTVEFNKVYFSYNNKKDILKNVSFVVQPGKTVAFVGATGAGKSTVLKLLDRFYDVSGGSIKIDDQDIRDVDINSLRSRIGIVPQSPIMFNDTVMNNVRYARLDAPDEDVYKACRAAAVHDQIEGFSDGYQTMVGERGIKLSGGELQRVAIARAILKNPSIVLLDEATSAVDTETEQKIQSALRALCKDRTTFVVAHRLSTIMNADTIIVIENGQITESGNHEYLIKKNGKYASLWSKQIFSKSGDELDDDESGLVNDLTTEENDIEVGKAQQATDAALEAEAQTNSGSSSTSSAEDTPDCDSGSDTAIEPSSPTEHGEVRQ